MEKITTYELLKALKRNLAIIIAMTLGLGILGGVYARYIKTEEYTAQTVMIIVGNDDEEISYNKLLLNEKLSNIYSQILTSEDIYKDVIEELKLKNIKPRELKENLKTEVNAQAGIISFELLSDSEDKASDSLKEICEKFKSYVKDYLKTDNLEYLQDVSVKNESKQDFLKFGIIGLVLGFLLSILFVCIKEVTSQKIKDEQYIRDLGIDVLGVIETGSKDQYRKIFAKVANKIPNGIFGITSFDKTSSSNISINLGRTMAEIKKVLLVDLDNEVSNKKDFANINEISRNEGDFLKDGKLYRLNFTKSDDVDIFIENESFINLIERAGEDFDYIIINEKSIETSQSYFTKSLEDGKILLVDEGKTNKNDFNLAVQEIQGLGFKLLGVIYHK